MCYVYNQWYDISCAALYFLSTDVQHFSFFCFPPLLKPIIFIFFSNYMKNSLFHTVKQSGILLLALLKYSSHLSLRHWKQRCRIIYLSLKPRPISFVNIIYKIMRQYPCWSLTSSVTWPASHVTQNLRSYIHLLQSTIFAVTSLSKFEPYSFPMCRIKFFFQYKFTKLQCISPSPPGS